jgi:hypothetical protein
MLGTFAAVDATAVIAIYAALVATAGVLVQYSQWRSSRTQLQLVAFAGVAPVPSIEAGAEFDQREEREEVLFIQLTNRSPHPIKIVHVGLTSAGRRDKRGAAFARPYPLHLRLPFEVPARDNVMLWQPRNKLGEQWEECPVQVRARTAAGEDFKSESFRIEGLPRMEIT